ncbi:NfeD family protein [Dethiothermospora halolimnae]|uniref:NfeD family protein n=1 Tax=Dethiothermospora halolimnae TaxID=3114390 RepID=UPI003CCBF6A4
MRGKIISILFIVCIFLSIFSNNIAAETEKDVYIIPIEGEINTSTYQFIKKEVNKIDKYQAKAIIFDIDTYGGEIEEAEKIKNLIMDLEVPTISFVNNKAESAGVLLTISSEKVVMSHEATIGSAETIPNTEKILSFWVSLLKNTAKNRGRDPRIIAAMADKDVEIKGIVKKGKLLNLGARDAKKYGIADLIANDYKDILQEFDIQYRGIKTIDISLKVKLAGIITSPYISTLLIYLGLIGLIIELIAPGFGAGGTVSLVSFALFFGGNILAGNSGLGVLIIFLAGLVLIVIEALIPGFGIPGIGGIIFILASLVLAMDSLALAGGSILIALILTVISTYLLIKYGQRSPYLDKIVLGTKQTKNDGYTSLSDKDKYLNQRGVVVSYLRPSGTIEIEGKRVDAVSQGDFIKKGEVVKVIKVEGPKVIVKKID